MFGKKRKERKLRNRLDTISAAKPLTLRHKSVRGRRRKKPRPPRRAVFWPGAVYTRPTNGMRCAVRDLSGAGARIAMEGVFALPEEVVLKVPQAGIAKRARVVWHDETEAGLAFLSDVERRRRSKPPTNLRVSAS